MIGITDPMTVYLLTLVRVRLAGVRASRDRGSGPVETAVVVAGLLAAAIAVVAAITMVVDKYKSKIR